MAVGDAVDAAALPVAVPTSVSVYAEGMATRFLCAAAHLRAPMLPASSVHRIPVGRARRAALLALEQGSGGPLPVGRAYARRVLRSGPLMALVPGVDAERIAWHCRIARRQLWVRDIFIGLFAIISGLLLIVGVAVVAFSLAPRFVRREIAPFAVALVLVFLAVGQQGLVLLAPLAGAVACWTAFFADNLLARQRLRRLGNVLNDPQPQSARESAGRRQFRAMVPRISEHNVARGDGERNVVRRVGEQDIPPDERDYDVVPYARDRIVGAGVSDGARTITIAVDKPAKDSVTRHFEAHELLEHVADNAREQGRRYTPTHGIPRLDVALVLGVPESRWRRHARVASRAMIYRCADDPQSGAAERAFVRVQAVAWDGQLVVSLYVSTALEGRYLNVTVLPHVLPPVVTDLRIVDGLESRHMLVHVSHAAVDALRELLQLGKRIYEITDRGVKERRPKRERKEQQRADLVSLRELYAQHEPDDIVQRDDALRIINTIQTRVFGVTEQFLKDHGIDTEEFTSQVQYIMQNSVIVQGDVTGNLQNVQGDRAKAVNRADQRKGASP